ncbi:MAG: DNA mismatch repair protein MutL [Chloroflexi bacterium OLB15]|nr:MAG: DNA mismatch repair protein MutL [Chloroflexi bacterium OLB15]
MSIHVLPEDVVVKIAAGEVIERPSSVVKELVENSLDAGATFIRISVQGDGRQRIEISDDGMGIPNDEVEVAFARHATSKLRQADDLYSLNTLGFRGEALASIAAVSRVTLTTRAEAETQGTLIRLEAGQIRQRRGVGVPRGTQIVVENLFFNTPARLKFLKSEQSEKRQISSIVTRYAMAYPYVRFVLEQDGREIFRSNGSGQLLDVMLGALGLDNLKSMFEVSDAHLNVHIYGFTSAPNYNRSDRSRITLFVNGRWITDSSLTFAVTQAYHTLLMTGRYPVAVLMLQVSPEDVDVNVHPTKAEVRFRDPDAVFSAVQRAVRRAVIDHAQLPAIRTANRMTGELVWSPEGSMTQAGLDLQLMDAGQHARHHGLVESASVNDEAESADELRRPRTLPLLRIVGQVGASYIIAEGPAGLYLIDQHAAHERVLYEAFMAAHARKEPAQQFTLDAQSITLAPDQAHVLESNLGTLAEIGFEIEPFGPNVFVIRAVPAMLSDDDPIAVINQIVMDMEQGLAPGQKAIEDKIVLQVCKRAAVKAGQILSMEQMQSIIRQLERCDSPLTCPHGRPTMIHMTSDQLAREFGRLGS